ncbi:MAG: hypothetical protein JWN40_4515 [Phycisphaerales bacterium]|nr:hypothetical protein [Phycisphaerales bacterium]
MRRLLQSGVAEASPNPAAEPDKPPKPPKRRRRWLRRLGKTFLVLFGLLLITRPMMPWAVRWYVNRTLDQSPIYQGKIGDVELHLWRGAYSIRDVRLVKMTGNVPVPLFAAPRVEFALQWDALMHGRLVGRVLMEQPELNFVDAPSEAESQTGAGGPWFKILRDLSPFKINRAEVHDGSVHFRTYATAEPVDVYLSHLDATVDNLTNIRDETTPLLTTVTATALVMDQAKLEYKMRLDPFSYRPTFHMTTRLLGLDVTKINNMAMAYGAFDFKRGWFNLVVEVDAKEGQLAGYVKPLFRNLKMFSLKQDIKEDNVLQFFWQAILGVTTSVLKNQPRDQFGTLIPFRGDATAPNTDILATIGNVLRNAFIRAYLPRLQNSGLDAEGLQFEPPSLDAPISEGDQP